MPIYSFRCKRCAAIVDISLPITERESQRLHSNKMDGCHGRLERVVSKVNLVGFDKYGRSGER